MKLVRVSETDEAKISSKSILDLDRCGEDKMLEKNEFSLTKNAQYLRKNMTPEELKLWRDCLHDLPVTVNRQRQIGEYIVDFYCAKAKLVIEIDGSRHFSKEGKSEDKKRDCYLKSLGLTVMRFSNSEVTNEFKKVSQTIINFIESVLADEG